MRPSQGRGRQEIIWVILLVNFQASLSPFSPLSSAPERKLNLTGWGCGAPSTNAGAIMWLITPSVMGCPAPGCQSPAGTGGQGGTQGGGRHGGHHLGHWPHPGLPPLDSLAPTLKQMWPCCNEFLASSKGGSLLQYSTTLTRSTSGQEAVRPNQPHARLPMPRQHWLALWQSSCAPWA